MLDQAFGGFPPIGLHQVAAVEKNVDRNQMFLQGERGGIASEEGRAGENLHIN